MQSTQGSFFSDFLLLAGIHSFYAQHRLTRAVGRNNITATVSYCKSGFTETCLDGHQLLSSNMFWQALPCQTGCAKSLCTGDSHGVEYSFVRLGLLMFDSPSEVRL